MIYILIGIAGSGKTTIGKRLADRLAVPFHDADDYHSQGNIEKMRRGIPLDEGDRMPWLRDLSARLAEWKRTGSAVLACSALKESYRKILTNGAEESVVYIHLSGDEEKIKKRLKKRKGHYFSVRLLATQVAAWEPPANAIEVGIDGTPSEICDEIIQCLNARSIRSQHT